MQLVNDHLIRDKFVDYDLNELRSSGLLACSYFDHHVERTDNHGIENAIDGKVYPCTLRTSDDEPCNAVFHNERALARHMQHTRLHASTNIRLCSWI